MGDRRVFALPRPDCLGGTYRPAGPQPQAPPGRDRDVCAAAASSAASCRNRKRRPAVIVTPDSEIGTDGEVWVVGVSTQLAEAPAEFQVELPWDRRGHPRTGLKERCAAVCTWMVKVKVADIHGFAGTIPGRQLLDILTRIKPPEAPGKPVAPE